MIERDPDERAVAARRRILSDPVARQELIVRMFNVDPSTVQYIDLTDAEVGGIKRHLAAGGDLEQHLTSLIRNRAQSTEHPGSNL